MTAEEQDESNTHYIGTTRHKWHKSCDKSIPASDSIYKSLKVWN